MGPCLPLGMRWGQSSAQPPAGPQARPSHSSWSGCCPAAAASPEAPRMVPGDARAPRLSHLLRPRRPHSVFVPSADASRGHSFSSLLQKVPLDVGTALLAISSRIICSTITHHPSPTIAGGALACTARVLGQVSLPYGAAPPAKPTAAHEDASDSLHHGSPRSSLNAIRESFLKSGLSRVTSCWKPFIGFPLYL